MKCLLLKFLLVYLLPLILFSVATFSQKTQSDAVAETMSNTFNFYGDKLTGTCFMIIKDGQQYFVAAAHLFESFHKSGDIVSVQMVVQNQLQPFNATVYFHTNRKVDVAVFKLSERINQKLELPDEYIKDREFFEQLLPGKGISTDSMFSPPAMDVFFLGFPLGNLGNEIYGVKLPLVKKAVLSGWVDHNGITMTLLDGHNNLGFSGGPVVAYDTVTKKMNLIGVISGYIPEPLDVKQKKKTLSVNANSGIIICYGKKYIDEVFSGNKSPGK